MERLYFLADIMKHFNELNVKLHGKNKFIRDLARDVKELKLKLVAFNNQIKDNDYQFFPVLDTNQYKQEFDGSYNIEVFVRYLDILINALDSRFSDFQKFQLAFKFLKNPFVFDENDIQNLSDLFNTDKNLLQFDVSLKNEETRLPNELRCKLSQSTPELKIKNFSFH